MLLTSSTSATLPSPSTSCPCSKRAATPHTPPGEHPRGGEDFEYPTDVWLPGGFEDDHGNRPFGSLLVAGVALENRDDLGPELVPLLFGSDAGDHGASRACDRDAYLWVGTEIEVPCRVPVIAAERGNQHQSVAVNDRYREHRRACLTRPASGGDEFDEEHPEGFAEDPSLRDVEDHSVNTGAHLVERVFGCHETTSISLRVRLSVFSEAPSRTPALPLRLPR